MGAAQGNVLRAGRGRRTKRTAICFRRTCRRIDEAVQYFCQYHTDGVERMYLKYEVTQADVTRMTTDSSESITQGSVTTSWKQGANFLVVPASVISVVNVFPLSDRANLNMFDVRYQLRLNDLYDFSSTSIVHYEMTMRHLDFLDHAP